MVQPFRNQLHQLHYNKDRFLVAGWQVVVQAWNKIRCLFVATGVAGLLKVGLALLKQVADALLPRSYF